MQLGVLVQPAQLLQPYTLEHVEHELYVGKPEQVPEAAPVEQPGQRAHVCDEAHCAQVVNVGVPEQVGAARN